ncbi:MAG: hypothetical protein HY351_03935 [Candidatus Omnitrophica bacterium]|nr:hypothetical protein [Candidatus Omnitrophota bacterium]
MKTDKKLKRGLADLSQLFAESSEPLTKRREVATFTIEVPQDDPSSDLGVPRLICASFLDSGNGCLEPSSLIRLLEILKISFQETFLLSIAPDEMRYDAFARLLPIPARHVNEGGPICLHSVADRIAFGHISSPQFEATVQPKMALGYSCDLDFSKKALTVLDLGSTYDSRVPSSISGANVLDVLDHGVFVTQPDLNQLQKTYELIKFSLNRNPMLRCSILLTGQNAGNVWELVYERFNGIVSQFLGCDLGFLGWSDAEDFALNPDLLLEESKSARSLSFKSCLTQTFYHSVSSE